MADPISEVWHPDQMPIATSTAFQRIVTQAGKVSAVGLPDRMKRAIRFSLLIADDTYVATAALKRPEPAYVDRVFRSAGIARDDAEPTYELGWVVVDGSYRGRKLSRTVIEPLQTFAPSGLPAWATTSCPRMEQTLKHFGFAQQGTHFESTEAPGTYLRLYVSTAFSR